MPPSSTGAIPGCCQGHDMMPLAEGPKQGAGTVRWSCADPLGQVHPSPVHGRLRLKLSHAVPLSRGAFHCSKRRTSGRQSTCSSTISLNICRASGNKAYLLCSSLLT